MAAWDLAGRVKAYEVMYGYGGGNRDIQFGLDLDDHSISIVPGEHGPLLGITVKFGDYQAGGIIGEVSHAASGGISIRVELPRDEVHTFWRSIRDVQGHVLSLHVDENDAVTLFVVHVAENLMVDTDEVRREVLSSMLQRLGVTFATERLTVEPDKERRERVDSMLQRLGVTSASY